tara:strand:- start:78007 stop:78756 length:750 start_codon:yes stop_codon:yes gene_type:complete
MNLENNCITCQRDLRKAKEKYAWLVGSGYSNKNAVEKILHDPESSLPPKKCCIVSIQFDLPTESPHEYKKKIDAQLHELANQQGHGAEKFIKERYYLFVTDPTGSIAGDFVLDKAPFNKVEMLTTNLQKNGQEGHKISNITGIPDTLAADKNFDTTNNSIMLWSGNIRILPLYQEGGESKPGIIIYRNTRTGEAGQLDRDNVSFLESEFIEYSLQSFQLNSRGNVSNQVIGQSMHSLLVEQIPARSNPY